MNTCIECGNVPQAPNYLSIYEDGDGDEYAVCVRCEDFQSDYDRATEKVQAYLVTKGYFLWQRFWELGMRCTQEERRDGDE